MTTPTQQGNIAGLYLHVPFCFHKCHYCDFYSIVDDDRHDQFVDRLISELTERCQQMPLQPRTLFVGGGTPTLLDAALWSKLLAALASLDVLAEVVEFTVEANPETVTPHLAATLAAGGVNRVSIGSQTSDPSLLKTLERWHDPANVAQAAAHFRAAGITNINLDHIFAIPGQTMAMLDADLDRALAIDPDHLSYYGLTYEPNTAMTARLRAGQFTPMDEDLEKSMFEHIIARLKAAGYEHYEISNWSKPGQPCEHNLIYWRGENWLGIGPSAASHIDGERWKNAPHLGRYLEPASLPPIIDRERLPGDEQAGERLMMRLRLREGVPAALWPTDARRAAETRQLIDLNLLERADTHIRLTDRGLMVADSVIGKLL